MIRLLNADEIEVRVQSTKKTKTSVGCILLLYKDARVDMRILDEEYGVNGWQRTHEVINGNLFCNIDIWDNDKKCWIRKQDVGVESNTEKEKGQASDSFKRAGFNIGIGRELYSSPFIWINLENGEYFGEGDKVRVNSTLKFEVKSISYNDKREIETLEIMDNKGKVRYTLGKAPSNNSYDPFKSQSDRLKDLPEPVYHIPMAVPLLEKISEAQQKRLFAIAGKEHAVMAKEIMLKYGYESSKDILKKDYEKICKEIEGLLKGDAK